MRSTAAVAAPTSSAIGAVRYVAIGASDAVGVGASDPPTGSWPARVAAHLPPGSAFVNVGVSGSTAPQAQEQQLPRAIAQRPNIVSIWLAVNDMNAQIPPETYASALAYVSGGICAFMSLTASQIETMFGRCAMARGSCCSCACGAVDPETPTLTNALPGGRCAATRAGHDPVGGSLAPTPTASDAPIAT